MSLRKELRELKIWLGWEKRGHYDCGWNRKLEKPCVDPKRLVAEFKELKRVRHHGVSSWDLKQALDKIGYLENRVTRLDSCEKSGNITVYPVRELIRALYDHLGLVAEEVPSITAFLKAVPKKKDKSKDNGR